MPSRRFQRPRTGRVILIVSTLLAQAAGPFGAAAADKGEAPPKPVVGDADLPPTDTAPAPAASQALGMKVDTFAGGGQVKNPTAFAFDRLGRLYVTESYRWRRGVEDNRDHTDWVMDDLACQTTADRLKVQEKFKPKLGDDYFTAEADRVIRLEDTDGDGKADKSVEFAGGFKDALDGPAIGLLAVDNGAYMTCIPKLWLLKDEDGDGKAEKRQAMAEGFGVRVSLAGHDLHGLTWGPDGKLYFSMGDRGYNVKTQDGRTLADPGAGAVFRCNADGSELEVFHYGLRNPQELAFNERGDLFTVDNNSDQGDQARVCWLVEGGDAGWHMGHQALTTSKPFLEEGHLDQPPHWLAEKLWQTPFPGQPRWIVPPLAHVPDGPSGLIYTSGLSLPERYRSSFFICDYKGSANQCRLWSFHVVPKGAGYEVADPHIFHSGVANVDVEEGADGKLYLLDFGGGWQRSDAGNVFALYTPAGLKQPGVADAQLQLKADFSAAPADTLLPLLSHADWRVRQKAQFALASKAEPPVEALATLAGEGKNLHAVWALRQLKAAAPLRELLNHADAELRAQAARALGDLRDGEAVPRLRELLADESPRVRMMAALAIGRSGDAKAVPSVLAMVEKQGIDDAFLRHSGVMALAGIAPPPLLASLRESKAFPVRLSACLALRKLRSPLVAEFLRDDDKAIAAEAVRAINDLALTEAMPALAREARRFLGQAPPALYLDEMIFRRMLHANQVVGTPETAGALASLATHPALPESFRHLALLTLENFPKPPPIDPTTGIYRPLAPRDPAGFREPLTAALAPLLTQARGDLTADALRVATAFGLPVGEKALIAWASDDRQPLGLRMASVDRLGAEAVRPLLDVATPQVRAEAALRWVTIKPDELENALRILLAHATDHDLHAAYDLLAASKHAKAPDLMAAELAKFIEGKVPPTVQLDLLEAAGQRTEDAVKTKLEAAVGSLAGKQQTPYDLTLIGGDVAKGRLVFQNQGLCMKCHRIGPAGGTTGPRLDGVAKRLKPADLLQSLLNPNAAIVQGYGIAAFTLTDGTVVSGTPLEESATEVQVRTPTGGVERVAVEKIKERTPPVSPMPPMGLTLPKRDLRDLLAYMQTLTVEPASAKPAADAKTAPASTPAK